MQPGGTIHSCHLTSLCLHVPRADAAGLGIFRCNNLEGRIALLTKKTLSFFAHPTAVEGLNLLLASVPALQAFKAA